MGSLRPRSMNIVHEPRGKKQLSMWIRWCIVMFMIYTYAVEYIQTGTDIYAQIMQIVFYIIIILIHVFIYMYIFIYLLIYLFYLLILFFIYSLFYLLITWLLFIYLFIYLFYIYICAHYIHIWVFQKRTYVAYRLFGYDSHIASCYRLRCAFAAWEQRWCR